MPVNKGLSPVMARVYSETRQHKPQLAYRLILWLHLRACCRVGREAVVDEKQCCVMPVSRSEAGQQKALLVLDTDWRELERIPLDLGARHFSLASAVPEVPSDLRAGDRCG